MNDDSLYKNIPLRSWDGKEALIGYSNLIALDTALGVGNLAVANCQVAVQMCLELLGSRTALVPVVLSITSPPDTLAGIVRGGGHPCLVDIDEETLQMAPDALAEVLNELDGAVVVLSSQGGRVDPRLLSLVKDYPTILDARTLPKEPGDATFTIYDLSDMLGTGAVICTKFEQQGKELFALRNGILGHNSALPEVLCALALRRLPNAASRQEDRTKNASIYRDLLGSADGVTILDDVNSDYPVFTIQVEDAEKILTHLRSFKIEAALGVYPMHFIETLRARWSLNPSYPNAERMSKKVVALPTHNADAEFIAKEILDIL